MNKSLRTIGFRSDDGGREGGLAGSGAVTWNDTGGGRGGALGLGGEALIGGSDNGEDVRLGDRPFGDPCIRAGELGLGEFEWSSAGDCEAGNDLLG